MELVIKQKSGVEHVVIYDECDHGLVLSHRWHKRAGQKEQSVLFT
jgi:hypothetical protein